MEKITKRDRYMAMINILNGEDASAVDTADLVEFCENCIADLDKKAAKAKERAANKKSDLYDLVYSVMTEDYQAGADIAAEVIARLPEDPEMSAAKVTAQITKLVNDGKVEKAQATVEVNGKKGKRMVYKLAESIAEAE